MKIPRYQGGFFPLQINDERLRTTIYTSAMADPLLDATLDSLGVKEEVLNRFVSNLIDPIEQTEDRYAACIKIGILAGIRLMAQELTLPNSINADDFRIEGRWDK